MQDSSEIMPSLDPTKIFTDDILVRIFRLLPARQLFKCNLVSSHWHRAANLPEIWEEICQTRWEGKVYIPAAGQTNLTWKQKYLKAESDRQHSAASITFTELTTFDWRFRFKRQAGTWFQETDPYWVHGKDESKMMRRRFIADGSVFRAPEGDPFHDDDNEEEMKWKFTRSGEVQVEHYPPLRIRRTPDWGFLLENAWVVLVADLRRDGPFVQGIETPTGTL
jgi:F-box-like